MTFIIETLHKMGTPYHCSFINTSDDISKQKKDMAASLCSICKKFTSFHEDAKKVKIFHEPTEKQQEEALVACYDAHESFKGVPNAVIFKIPKNIIIVDTDDEVSEKRVRAILTGIYGEEMVKKYSTPSISRALGINAKKGFHYYFMRDEKLKFEGSRIGLTGGETGAMDILGNGSPTSGWIIEHYDSEICYDAEFDCMNMTNELLQRLTGQKQKTDSERSGDETSDEAQELEEKFRSLDVWQKFAEMMPNEIQGYDEWLSVMKFFKRYFPDDGFEIFSEWSEKYPQYLRNKPYSYSSELSSWSSLKAGNVSIGTIIFLFNKYHKQQFQNWMKWVDAKNVEKPKGGALDTEDYFIPLNIVKGTTFQIAERMSNEIKKYAVYYRNQKGDGQWYIFNEKLKLWMTGKIKPATIIARTVRRFFMASIAKISGTADVDEKDTANTIKTYLDVMKKLDTPGNTSQFIEHLSDLNLDIDFKNKLDQTTDKIVYRNGIYDIKSDTFRPGIFYEDFLTFTLPFDYVKAKPDAKERVKKILMEINSQEEWKYEYYIKMLGYSLTGQAKKETVYFMMIGLTAGNGKSCVLDCLTNRMVGYVKKMQNDAFEVKNTKKHKQFADVENNRIIWLNEVSQKNEQDVEYIKNYADGIGFKNEVMHGTESDVKVNSKVFFVSNGEPKFVSDEGMRRRYRYVEFGSKFFDDDEQMQNFTNNEPDPKRHYIADTTVPSFLESDDGMSALLEILYDGARMWYVDGLKTPQQYDKLKQAAISANDMYSEFIRKHFKPSNKGSIWKGQLENFWDICGYDGVFDLKDCIKKMREKGYVYDADKNKKINKATKTGCFINIEFVEPVEVEEVD